MKLPSMNSLITQLVILTLFHNIFVICSSRRVKRLTHMPVQGGTRYIGTVRYGHPAALGQFPWMVVVHHLLYRDGIGCGGTVISSRWVLTAGHCVVDHPRSFLTVFGDVDKNHIHGTYYNGPGIVMLTKQAVLHPNYVSDKSLVRNDIGLLYMPRDIPFGATIQPLRLAGPDHQHESFTRYMGIIAGWGQTGPVKKLSRFLLWGKIPMITNDECRSYWPWLSDDQMCAKPKTGNDVCSGDSGGPLVLRSLDDGEYLQIGIVSYGDEYCPSSSPGVFTSVRKHYRWIKSYVNDLQ